MRMWMINPALLCRKHLLGEHNEIHLHLHIFLKHRSIHGRIYPVVQIVPERMQMRHNTLVEEMLHRGYRHQSPYEQPNLNYLSDDERYAHVDIAYNLADLSRRCKECRERIAMHYIDDF